METDFQIEGIVGQAMRPTGLNQEGEQIYQVTQPDHPKKSFLLSLNDFLVRSKKGKEGECEAGKRRKKALRQKRVSWGLKHLTR